MATKKPEGEARDAVIIARVRPAAAARFRAEAKARGLTISEAARQAFAQWIRS
jgi:hypothetical protein